MVGRTLVTALVALVMLGGAPRAQGPAFDAVSIKLNRSGDARMSSTTRGRTLTITNMPLRPVIAQAFDVSFERFRLVGGPPWIGGDNPPWPGADRYDIVATVPEGSRPAQQRDMLQAMLAERFHLAVHRETRDAPIYSLVLARSDRRLGAGLRRSAVDCDALRLAGSPLPEPLPGQPEPCATQIDSKITGRGQSMASLARMLVQFVERTVVDRTGLSGGYDFDLSLPEQNAGRSATVDSAAGGTGDLAGGIFSALQEDLGLKLESARGSVEFVVIDRVERPTAD
jgi:uncharacterized protein (TIGR03435 family)